MMSDRADYARFLSRLALYERFEPFPRTRGPEKLAGVRRLAAELEHPERACRVVHVAGTNGKGLTAAMIARLLVRAGRRTGLYTSPHVADIRERITLEGAPVPEAVFARAGHRVLDVADRLRASLHFSYFDLLTLIAWEAFRAESMDWAVLETGLGGLSDATNIAPKELCVLTRIGLDHLHVLGDTLEAIAAQKLGIVTPGVPTVLAEQPAGLEPWLRARLAERDSAVSAAGAFRLELPRPGAGRLEGRWTDGAPLGLPLAGDAPRLSPPALACAANALAAGELLLGPAEGEERPARLAAALETRLPGRLELRRAQRLPVPGAAGPSPLDTVVLDTVVLDGGHNPDAVAALVAQLARWGLSDYTLVLSLQSDKLVKPLAPPLRELLTGAARVLALAPRTPRAPSPEVLRAFLAPLQPAGRPAPETVAGPLEALLAAAEAPGRPVVVTGSFWMVGDVINLLERGASREGAGG